MRGCSVAGATIQWLMLIKSLESRPANRLFSSRKRLTKCKENPMRRIIIVALTTVLLATTTPCTRFLPVAVAAEAHAVADIPSISVGPQYDTTHVYVAPSDFERFTTSIIATFGGT